MHLGFVITGIREFQRKTGYRKRIKHENKPHEAVLSKVGFLFPESIFFCKSYIMFPAARFPQGTGIPFVYPKMKQTKNYTSAQRPFHSACSASDVKV